MKLPYELFVGLRYFRGKSSYSRIKNPYIGFILALLFGPLGFLYYSFEAVLIWEFILAGFCILHVLITGEAPPLAVLLFILFCMATYAYVDIRWFHPRRERSIALNTFVSIEGITLGVAALIGTLGIMTGFKEDLQSKILGTTSHVIVQERAKQNMGNYWATMEQVEEVPRVLAATPFVLKQVLLTSHSGVQGIVLRGIDPAKEVEVTELGSNIKRGRLEDLATNEPIPPEAATAPSPAAGQALTPTPVRRGIVLGKELSRRLNAIVGDTVNVVSPVGPIQAVSIVPKIRSFKVVAIFESGMYEYDSSLAYISLAEAQKFFNMGDTVSGIEVKVDDIFAADDIAYHIEASLGFTLMARDWMRLNRNLFSALKLEKTMMFLLLVFISVVASFNIVSALTMIVSQKQREIAILKAMGSTRNAIMRIFILHGITIGVVGTTIGIPLGYAALGLIQTYFTFDPTVYYISRVPVDVQTSDVLLVSIVAILISLVATLSPSWRAGKLDPAAALRYE